MNDVSARAELRKIFAQLPGDLKRRSALKLSLNQRFCAPECARHRIDGFICPAKPRLHGPSTVIHSIEISNNVVDIGDHFDADESSARRARVGMSIPVGKPPFSMLRSRQNGVQCPIQQQSQKRAAYMSPRRVVGDELCVVIGPELMLQELTSRGSGKGDDRSCRFLRRDRSRHRRRMRPRCFIVLFAERKIRKRMTTIDHNEARILEMFAELRGFDDG